MTLIRTHDSSKLAALKAAARDQTPLTRALTAIALSGYPRSQAEPILTELAKDPVDIVKRSAAAALSDIAALEKAPKPAPSVAGSGMVAGSSAGSGGSGADHPLRQKNGPRLALDQFATRAAPSDVLTPAARTLSEALDASPLPMWTGEVGTSGHKATYTLIGGADWSEHKSAGAVVVKVRLHGVMQRLPAYKLVGEVSSQGTATLPAGTDPSTRASTLQSMLRRVADAAVGDLIDLANVDRQTSGEPLLR